MASKIDISAAKKLYILAAPYGKKAIAIAIQEWANKKSNDTWQTVCGKIIRRIALETTIPQTLPASKK